MHEGVHHLADIRWVGAKTANDAADEGARQRPVGRLDPAVATEAMKMVVAYLQRVGTGPVWRPIEAHTRDWLVNQPLPEASRPVPELIGDIKAHVLPYPMGNGHRRFFGWVNSPPSAAGIAVEPLAAALNPSCAGGEHASSLLERTGCRSGRVGNYVTDNPSNLGKSVTADRQQDLGDLGHLVLCHQQVEDLTPSLRWRHRACAGGTEPPVTAPSLR
jgi:hypothetical protein